MRKKYTNRNRMAKALPLFDWADAQRRLIGRPTAAERMLRRRGCSPSSAKLYASLAGFPVQGDDND